MTVRPVRVRQEGEEPIKRPDRQAVAHRGAFQDAGRRRSYHAVSATSSSTAPVPRRPRRARPRRWAER